VLRGHAAVPEHVLILATLGAPERRLVRGRRGRRVGPDPAPTPVTTTRATLVRASPLGDRAAGARWLAAARSDSDAPVDDALAALNRVLHAQRVATAEPSVRELGRGQAIAVRIGIGEGEQVADGRWTSAFELPGARARRRRDAALRSQERLAALLGGRDVALACEELALRARQDLDAGRRREGALQLHAALTAALAELEPWTARGDLTARAAELRSLAPAVAQAAEAALQGGIDDATAANVERALGRLEAALRARTALGFD
jgi:hypothetical protein